MLLIFWSGGVAAPPQTQALEYAVVLVRSSPLATTLTALPLGVAMVQVGATPLVFPPAGDDLPEAIQAWFRLRPDLQALTSDGMLWELEAPEGTLYPFAEFFRVSEPIDTFTTGFRLYRTTVQFSFHAATLDTSRQMAKRFVPAFTMAPLIVAGLPILHFLPGEPSSGKGDGKGPNGEDSYMEMVEFDILFTRPF